MGDELRFALLGDPVGHSLSPMMLARAMEDAGIPGSYQAIRADVTRLRAEVEAVRRGDRHGLNVTMPLKEAAAELCDQLTPEALHSGSVNTIKAEGDEVVGHSTDVVAVATSLSTATGDSSLYVLGAGGSARAALAAAERVTYLAARRDDAARGIVSMAPSAAVVSWGAGVAGAVLVNATPLGMAGESLPPGLVPMAAGLIDLPYRSGATTPAAADARSRGIPVVDGIDFLALAAAASFAWWTGESVDSRALAELARNV